MGIRIECEASGRDKAARYECSSLFTWRTIGGVTACRGIRGAGDHRDGVIFLELLNEVSIVGLTDSVKERAIGLRRTYGLKLPDAIVAGTALVIGAELVTNDGKLERVPDLKVRKLVLRV